MKESDLIFGLMATFARQEYSVAQIRELAAPFGITESCVRTTLSRMRAKAQLTATRRGHSAFYKLGAAGRTMVDGVARGFRSIDWSTWDGRFWGVLFSVPERRRPQRHELSKRLRQLHFAPYYPGFWIRPLHRDEGIAEVFAGSRTQAWCTVIQFKPCSPFDAARADALWTLGALNEEMRVIVKKICDSRRRIVRLDPEAALVIKMKLGAAAVGLLARDPKLPGALLPQRWCSDALRRELAPWNVEITERARPFWEPILDSPGRR